MPFDTMIEYEYFSGNVFQIDCPYQYGFLNKMSDCQYVKDTKEYFNTDTGQSKNFLQISPLNESNARKVNDLLPKINIIHM